MKRHHLITLAILLHILLSPIGSSGHNVHEIEKVTLDYRPILRESRFGPITLVIDKDSTIVSLGEIRDFTIRHGMFGKINFTDYDLDYDGMEAYRLVLHQDIYFDNSNSIRLGRTSQTLSESALRDGLIYFSYILGDMNDIAEFVSDYVEPLYESIDGKIDNAKSQFQYRIENSLEFIRGTKQNARLFFEYEISSYEVPNIPTDLFHKELTLTTTLFPEVIEMQQSSVYYTHKVFLLLPIRLLPFYFKAPEDHSLNLTSVPINIYVDLEFKHSDTIKSSKVESAGHHGSDSENPLTDTDRFKQYRIQTEIADSQLVPIIISTNGYEGEIDISVSVKIKALFTDSSLYAKNVYPFSPNTYILIMVFTGTVFIYKLVDFVDYRKFQATLGYKNYDLVEKDFIR